MHPEAKMILSPLLETPREMKSTLRDSKRNEKWKKKFPMKKYPHQTAVVFDEKA